MKSFKVPLHAPVVTEEDMKAVADAMQTGWIAPGGPYVEYFEEELKRFSGMPSVVALSSGTAALHLALKAAGVGRGDYVIVPTHTYVATVSPIMYQGASPVFIESEPETLNMSPEYLTKALETLSRKGIRPKAVIPVHIYGFPAKIKEIVSIAKRYGLVVIEDAAEALGAEYEGQPVGTFGDFGVFSFNGNKIITTSGGGALLLKNPALEPKIRFWASHAKENKPWFYHTDTGYNYQMSNILAALGWSQMQRLQEILRKKKEIYTLYNIYMQNTTCKLHILPGKFQANYWLNIAWCEGKKSAREIIKILHEEKVEARHLWFPLHLMPVFSKYMYFGNSETQEFFYRGILLPSGLNIVKETLLFIKRIF